MSKPPIITSVSDLSDKSKMELVSFLQPFFEIRNGVKGGGGGTTDHDLLLEVNGMGAVITTGIVSDVRIDFSCKILGWTILADRPGDIQFDIWKNTYANYPPNMTASICGTAKPLIPATGQKATSTVLTGWTTQINAGDVIRFNVDSVDTIQRATLALHLK